MDRTQLRSVLEHEGISPRAYALDAGPTTPDATYAMDLHGFGWRVYYKDNGCCANAKTFNSEDEACDHLLDMVLRDHNTRIPRQGQ